MKKYVKIAKDFLVYLAEKELDDTVLVYADGKRYSTEKRPYTKEETYKNVTIYVEDNMLATDYFQYGNNDTMSFSFENYLYDLINYEDLFYLDDFFKPLGLWYELGNAWNASVYED